MTAPAPFRPALGDRHCGRRADRFRSGLSQVEVLVATLLVALALVPALEALQTGILGGAVHESLATRAPHLAGKLEELLAQPFAALKAEALASGGSASSYSDAGGTPDRRLVFLSGYDADDADGDGDPTTGADSGLLWVRVEIEATSHVLETLTTL